MMAISGIYGPEVWSTPITTFIPALANSLDAKTTLRDLWVPIILGSFCVAHLPACVYNVYDARKARGQPLAPLFLEWTPMIIFTASNVAWIGSPYSYILKDNHLVLLCLTLSLVFGRMTTKIILAHLTRQPFPYWTIMLAPLMAGAVLINAPYLGLGVILDAEKELLYLRAFLGFASIVYGSWAYTVINAICEYLGINALTIPSKKRNDPIAHPANGGTLETKKKF